MNTSRKAMEWLFYFSIVNLMFGRLLFEKFKKFNEIISDSSKFEKLNEDPTLKREA